MSSGTLWFDSYPEAMAAFRAALPAADKVDYSNGMEQITTHGGMVIRYRVRVGDGSKKK